MITKSAFTFGLAKNLKSESTRASFFRSLSVRLSLNEGDSVDLLQGKDIVGRRLVDYSDPVEVLPPNGVMTSTEPLRHGHGALYSVG